MKFLEVVASIDGTATFIMFDFLHGCFSTMGYRGIPPLRRCSHKLLSYVIEAMTGRRNTCSIYVISSLSSTLFAITLTRPAIPALSASAANCVNTAAFSCKCNFHEVYYQGILTLLQICRNQCYYCNYYGIGNSKVYTDTAR